MTTHTLSTDEVELVYDVHGPLPPTGAHRLLLLVGHPMDATGFRALEAQFPDRTVVTYDPRGLGRSVRKDGRTDHDPEIQAGDLHRLIAELGAGPVDLFGSSGGAVTGLALATAHPEDVHTLVAHEPPLVSAVSDIDAADRARTAVRDVYQEKGFNAGMAAFIAMTSWQGEYTDAYFEQAPPDPAAFGMSNDDDGKRDDPLVSDLSWAVSDYRINAEALTGSQPRVLVAVGEESARVFTGRTAEGAAAALGQRATVFPSHHTGFTDDEFGYAGQPEAFATRLRDVLDAN